MQDSSSSRGAGSPSKIGQHPRSRVKQFAPHTIHDVGRGYAEDVELFVDALLANVTFRQVLLNNYDVNSTVLDVAGGDGALSRELAKRGVKGLIVLDPLGLTATGDDDAAFDVAVARFRLPQHAHEWRRTALSRREDVEAELGREATLKEVAEASPEFSVEKLRLLRDVSLDPLSLDGKDDVFASPSDDADEVSR